MENQKQRQAILKKAKPNIQRNNQQRRDAPVNTFYRNRFSGNRIECVVKHRELVTAIDGGLFSQGTYKIQPGLALSFPWLANIAPAYETYEILRMSYHFVSRLPTTVGGLLYMAIDYDAADVPVVSSEQEISQYAGCVTNKIWQNSTLNVEKSKMRKQGRLYTRSGPLPSNTAIQDYDVGSLIYVVAGTSIEVAGSLYVDYEIKFTVPQAYDGSFLTNNSLSAAFPAGPVAYTSNVTNCFAVHLGEVWAPYNEIAEGLNMVVNRTELFFENLTQTGRYIYQFFIEIAPSVAQATVDAVGTALSSFQSTNTMQALSFITELTTGTLGLTRSTNSAGNWVLQGSVILLATAIGQRFGLSLASHTSLPGTSVIRILSRMSPYKY